MVVFDADIDIAVRTERAPRERAEQVRALDCGKLRGSLSNGFAHERSLLGSIATFFQQHAFDLRKLLFDFDKLIQTKLPPLRIHPPAKKVKESVRLAHPIFARIPIHRFDHLNGKPQRQGHALRRTRIGIGFEIVHARLRSYADHEVTITILYCNCNTISFGKRLEGKGAKGLRRGTSFAQARVFTAKALISNAKPLMFHVKHQGLLLFTAASSDARSCRWASFYGSSTRS